MALAFNSVWRIFMVSCVGVVVMGVNVTLLKYWVTLIVVGVVMELLRFLLDNSCCRYHGDCTRCGASIGIYYDIVPFGKMQP